MQSPDKAVVLHSMSMEDDFLNKMVLKRTVQNLLTHIEDLVKHTDLSSLRGVDLTPFSYILHLVHKNISLSPDDALHELQKLIPENIFNSLGRLTRHINSLQGERKPYKCVLKSFALSLHFYSLPLYAYVRQMSEEELPTSRSIEAWYASIDNYHQF